jgi:hypothetical protein
MPTTKNKKTITAKKKMNLNVFSADSLLMPIQVVKLTR